MIRRLWTAVESFEFSKGSTMKAEQVLIKHKTLKMMLRARSLHQIQEGGKVEKKEREAKGKEEYSRQNKHGNKRMGCWKPTGEI